MIIRYNKNRPPRRLYESLGETDRRVQDFITLLDNEFANLDYRPSDYQVVFKDSSTGVHGDTTLKISLNGERRSLTLMLTEEAKVLHAISTPMSSVCVPIKGVRLDSRVVWNLFDDIFG